MVPPVPLTESTSSLCYSYQSSHLLDAIWWETSGFVLLKWTLHCILPNVDSYKVCPAPIVEVNPDTKKNKVKKKHTSWIPFHCHQKLQVLCGQYTFFQGREMEQVLAHRRMASGSRIVSLGHCTGRLQEHAFPALSGADPPLIICLCSYCFLVLSMLLLKCISI